MLVETIEITHVLPCLADTSKIRIHAQPSADVGEALPYLNTVLPGAIYNHAALALTFTRDQRIISVFPHRVTAAKVDDLDDAQRLLEWLRDLMNETWERRSEVTPSCERRQRLTALSVFKLLPGTNCRACGFATCLAFAVEMAAERRSILQCGPLFAAAFVDKRALLLGLLKDAGYQVPSAFAPAAGS
jgi:ArsR family metal-binding transcriptional regulator